MKKNFLSPTAAFVAAFTVLASPAIADNLDCTNRNLCAAEQGEIDTINLLGAPQGSDEAIRNLNRLNRYADLRTAGKATFQNLGTCLQAETSLRAFWKTNKTNSVIASHLPLSTLDDPTKPALCSPPDSEPTIVSLGNPLALQQMGNIFRVAFGEQSTGVTSAISCGFEWRDNKRVAIPDLNTTIYPITAGAGTRFQSTQSGDFIATVAMPNSAHAYVQILRTGGQSSTTSYCDYNAAADAISSCRKLSSPVFTNDSLAKEQTTLNGNCSYLIGVAETRPFTSINDEAANRLNATDSLRQRRNAKLSAALH